MPTKLYRFKPKETIFIAVEVDVSYSCDEPPKRENQYIAHLEQLAFVIGHKYEVVTVVEDYTEESCSMGNCTNPLMYKFRIKAAVRDVVTLGFGAGNFGAVMALWRSEATEELFKFETPCICCDKPKKRIYYLQSHTNGTKPGGTELMPLIFSLSLLIGGVSLCLSGLDILTPRQLAMAFLGATGFGLACSLYFTASRLVRMAQRRKLMTGQLSEESHEGQKS